MYHAVPLEFENMLNLFHEGIGLKRYGGIIDVGLLTL